MVGSLSSLVGMTFGGLLVLASCSSPSAYEHAPQGGPECCLPTGDGGCSMSCPAGAICMEEVLPYPPLWQLLFPPSACTARSCPPDAPPTESVNAAIRIPEVNHRFPDGHAVGEDREGAARQVHVAPDRRPPRRPSRHAQGIRPSEELLGLPIGDDAQGQAGELSRSKGSSESEATFLELARAERRDGDPELHGRATAKFEVNGGGAGRSSLALPLGRDRR
jgi:hypothetical protein